MNEFTENYMNLNGVITLNKMEHIKAHNLAYESQNPYLWSGQYYLLKRFLNNELDCSNIEAFFHWHKGNIVDEKKGLFTRFPYPYATTYHYDAISFDEQNGLAFACIAKHDYSELDDIIDYGNRHNWYFIDKEIEAPKNSLFKRLSIIKDIIVTAFKTKKFGGSREIDKLIFSDYHLIALSRKRLPKDSAFLKMISPNFEPNLIEIIHFYLTSMKTIKKPKKSGVNMLLFKLIAFKMVGYTPWWVERLIEKYTQKDMLPYFKQFYPQDHPFVDYCEMAFEKLKRF